MKKLISKKELKEYLKLAKSEIREWDKVVKYCERELEVV